jgi:hypothetical protein
VLWWWTAFRAHADAPDTWQRRLHQQDIVTPVNITAETQVKTSAPPCQAIALWPVPAMISRAMPPGVAGQHPIVSGPQCPDRGGALRLRRNHGQCTTYSCRFAQPDHAVLDGSLNFPTSWFRST